MASQICDRTPCSYLQAALEVLIHADPERQSLALVVNSKRTDRVHFLVPITYCPFCGTRLDPDWIKTFTKYYHPHRR